MENIIYNWLFASNPRRRTNALVVGARHEALHCEREHCHCAQKLQCLNSFTTSSARQRTNALVVEARHEALHREREHRHRARQVLVRAPLLILLLLGLVLRLVCGCKR